MMKQAHPKNFIKKQIKNNIHENRTRINMNNTHRI